MTTRRQGAERSAGPVLVTGASGFIGSHLIDHLGRAGQPVVGVDLRIATTPPCPGADVRHITDDLMSMDIAPLLDGVSTVIHLAALSGVRPSWRRFDEYVESNIIATRRLLEACTVRGVRRLVIASSSSVYGNRQSGSMAEDQPPAPVSPYAVTKLAAEQLALAYAARPDSSLTTVALRLFTVYGPGQRPDMLIARTISAVLNGTEIRVFGDGSQRRDFVFVGDVVRAVVAAAQAPVGNQICNVGTGREVSVADVIALIGELTGKEPVVRLERRRAGDVSFTRADVIRTADVLGFRSAVPLREGLRRHIEAARRGPAPDTAVMTDGEPVMATPTGQMLHSPADVQQPQHVRRPPTH